MTSDEKLRVLSNSVYSLAETTEKLLDWVYENSTRLNRLEPGEVWPSKSEQLRVIEKRSKDMPGWNPPIRTFEQLDKTVSQIDERLGAIEAGNPDIWNELHSLRKAISEISAGLVARFDDDGR